MGREGYVPGVCNIGPAETRRRRAIGWLGVAGVVVLCIGLRFVDAAPVWRLSVFLPASVAASGFIQARMHFCANFGFRGIYNFGGPGAGGSVAEQEALAKDRRKALEIGGMSAAIGAVAAVAAIALASLT